MIAVVKGAVVVVIISVASKITVVVFQPVNNRSSDHHCNSRDSSSCSSYGGCSDVALGINIALCRNFHFYLLNYLQREIMNVLYENICEMTELPA